MGPSEDAEGKEERRWHDHVRRLRAGSKTSFERQWEEFQAVFSGRPADQGPPVVWRPGADRIAGSNLGRYLREKGFADYAALHAWSAANRADFWRDVTGLLGVVSARKPDAVVDLSRGVEEARWLPGASLNIVDTCLAGDPNRPAILSMREGREGEASLRRLTLGELAALVNRVSNGLAAAGFAAGDAVALYMPMTVECVAVYLGIVRAGCAAVSIADSFSPEEMKRRLRISGAKGIVTVDHFERGGKPIELYAKIRQADAPQAVVIPQDPARAASLRAGDLLWERFLGESESFRSAVGDPYRTTNILFSSGTTGDPKAIPWTHLTPLKCAMDGHFHQDIRPGDVVCWPTNIGWMMGPWLIYAGLMNGAAIALHEGLPTGNDFARFVERTGVTMLGLVPALVKAWRASGATEGADWSRVRLFSSTGEASNQEDYLWLMSRTLYRAPVIEYCGGTEIGGGHITGTVLQPASPATFTTSALGLGFAVLGEDGRPVKEGEMGELYVTPPSIGLSQALLNKDHHDVYYAGCPRGPAGEVLRRHGDQILRLGRGFWKAQGRADDTMNLGGIKVSSVELEEAVNAHPAVSESAAVAVIPGGEGADQLVIFAVLKEPLEKAPLLKALQASISSRLNPLFKIHDVVPVEKLPRTASNKVMRRELRREYLERAGGKG